MSCWCCIHGVQLLSSYFPKIPSQYGLLLYYNLLICLKFTFSLFSIFQSKYLNVDFCLCLIVYILNHHFWFCPSIFPNTVKLVYTDSSGRDYRICSHWANFRLIQVPPYTSFTVYFFITSCLNFIIIQPKFRVQMGDELRNWELFSMFGCLFLACLAILIVITDAFCTVYTFEVISGTGLKE
jgi:hypothetical protein